MPSYYCTVEDVRGALEESTSAYDLTQVLRAIGAGSDDVDNCVKYTNGIFRPLFAVYSYLWPDVQTSWYYRQWLDANRLISVTSIVSGGVIIPPLDPLGRPNYFLEPQAYGPPYDRVEIDLATSSAFSFAGTPQRATDITGLWGYDDQRAAAGTLAGALGVADNPIVVSDGSACGIGDHLIIDLERIEVLGKTWHDSTQTSTAPLAASKAANTVAVGTGSYFNAGEMILIDSERMLVQDQAANNLTVKRGYDGSVLAAHSGGAEVWDQHALVVTRGAQGSVAATHSNAAPITRHLVPPAVRSLAVASSVQAILMERSGWAVQLGPAGAGAQRRMANLDEMRANVSANYGRQTRTRVV